LATLGNIVGGVVFVGLLYWIGSPKAREAVVDPLPAPHFNGAARIELQEARS
jgi:hypothetical protein